MPTTLSAATTTCLRLRTTKGDGSFLPPLSSLFYNPLNFFRCAYAFFWPQRTCRFVQFKLSWDYLDGPGLYVVGFAELGDSIIPIGLGDDMLGAKGMIALQVKTRPWYEYARIPKGTAD